LHKHSLLITAFTAMLIITLVQTAYAEDIHIVDVYSDIDSADMTLRSNEYLTGIIMDADLIFEGKVLSSRHLKFEEIFPNTYATKVVSWDITNPRDGLYRTRITLSVNGSVLETSYYNFSHGWGWEAVPGLSIKDIISDSRGVSIILTPFVPQSGSEQKPVLTDVEYMLVDGDTVIFRTTDRRIAVAQATILSKDWNVRLENNHKYSARVKARITSPEDAVIARSSDFTAMDDARITELYRDETGASATILGLSQVPFRGSILFIVSKNGQIIEDIREPSPVLMSGDDETIEVTWKSRLPPGIYELSVRIAGNDGDVLNMRDTIIEAKKSRSDSDLVTPAPAQTPGFTFYSIAISLMSIYLLTRWVVRRNR